MEEAFEIYITDETYGIMAFKIKMLKLKILGTLLDAEYKGGDDEYNKLDPSNYQKIKSDAFNTYMTELINGDGKYDDNTATTKRTPNLKTFRLINVINFISSGFSDKLKDTLKIKYTPPSNPPTNETALYISQLKLIIGFYEDALASLGDSYKDRKGELTTTGVGAKKFLYGTRWYNWLAYTPWSVTDNEQRYRHAIFKRYMSIVRKYDEIMLKEISVEGSVDSKLLEAKKNFLTAFNALRDPSGYPKREDTVNALELLDAYNKKVEAAYVTIRKLGGAPVKYKYVPTGDVAYILYNKKRIKRNIYVKVKGRPTKYCKINKEYVLLSKLQQLR